MPSIFCGLFRLIEEAADLVPFEKMDWDLFRRRLILRDEITGT